MLHNYRDLECREYADAILLNAEVADTDGTQDRLVLIDVTNTVVDKSVMKAYRTIARQTSPRLSKIAVVGATGIQKLFVTTIANLFKLEVRAFDSREEALGWLTE